MRTRHLVRTRDKLAIVAALFEEYLRIGFPDVAPPIAADGIWAANPNTSTRDRWASNRPLTRCEWPGAQRPAIGSAERLDLGARLDISPPSRHGRDRSAEVFNLDTIEQSNSSRLQ